jgi:hypothetical protein
MEEPKKEYKRLDMDKLSDRIVRTVLMEEAIKDVALMEWPEEILSGEKRVVVEKAEKNTINKRIELEMSYR